MIYIIIALGLLFIEVSAWWLTHETTHTSNDIIARVGTKLERHFSQPNEHHPKSLGRRRLHAFLSWFKTQSFRAFVKNMVLRPCEIGNAIWLIYIVFAQ